MTVDYLLSITRANLWNYLCEFLQNKQNKLSGITKINEGEFYSSLISEYRVFTGFVFQRPDLLTECAKKGQLSDLKDAIKSHASTYTDVEMHDALHAAINNGKFECVRALRRLGCSVYKCGHANTNVFYVAVNADRVKILQYIIQQGALTARESQLRGLGKYGLSLLFYLMWKRVHRSNVAMYTFECCCRNNKWISNAETGINCGIITVIVIS